MNNLSPTARRTWRDVCRGGAALSAVMLGLSVMTALSASALPAGTAPTPGQTMLPASGTASTEITLALVAPDNACPGDTATGNFRWNMYIAAAGADPATIVWAPGASGGPELAGASFLQTMYAKGSGSSQLSKNTAVTTGQIVGTATVDFLTNTVPGNGVYNVGYACSKAPALGQRGQTERFWQTQITVTNWVNATTFDWAVTTGAVATTTTVAGATTTTTVAGVTTTTVAGATTTTTVRPTTTTVAGATTTTVAGATTTTTLVASAVPTTLASTSGGFNSGGFNSGGGTTTGNIPVTGPKKTVAIVVWAILLLVFGRMAILMARPIRVLPADSR